jgi:hypothetical protein
LDRGELDTVLKLIQGKIAATTLQELGKVSFAQFSQIIGGPKGLVEEAKDFIAAWRMVSLRFAIAHPDFFRKLQAIRQSLPF